MYQRGPIVIKNDLEYYFFHFLTFLSQCFILCESMKQRKCTQLQEDLETANSQLASVYHELRVSIEKKKIKTYLFAHYLGASKEGEDF